MTCSPLKSKKTAASMGHMVHPIRCASSAGNWCFSLSPLILLGAVTSASHQSLFNLLMSIVCRLFFKTTHVRHQPIYNYVRALFSVLGEKMNLSNGSWIYAKTLYPPSKKNKLDIKCSTLWFLIGFFFLIIPSGSARNLEGNQSSAKKTVYPLKDTDNNKDKKRIRLCNDHVLFWRSPQQKYSEIFAGTTERDRNCPPKICSMLS